MFCFNSHGAFASTSQSKSTHNSVKKTSGFYILFLTIVLALFSIVTASPEYVNEEYLTNPENDVSSYVERRHERNGDYRPLQVIHFLAINYIQKM